MTPTRIPTLTRRIERAVPPLALFRALTDDGAQPHTVLLESAEPGSRRHEKSLLVVSAALSLTCTGRQVEVVALKAEAAFLLDALEAALPGFAARRAGLHSTFTAPVLPAAVDDHERLSAASPLDVLRAVLRALQPERADLPESVFLTGLLSYDLAGAFEALPPPRRAGPAVPHYRFYLADQLVVVDHQQGRTEILAAVLGEDAAGYERARSALAHIVEAAEAVTGEQDALSDEDADPAPEAAEPSVDLDDSAFAGLVRTLKGHIARGDVFQIVASRTFSLPCPDPLDAYERLRAAEPAPYLFYLNAGEFTLFGASPESAVRVDGKSRRVEVSPIAGTRPRGLDADGRIDAELDARYEADLRRDPKENAEHLMLVDLARNDVARVSRSGTRRVAELLRLERFGRVMHLVSRVTGEMAPGLDALHACQACLNPGTLTGAPKLRAMQLLREYEVDARGHYGGAVGYFRGDGSLDTAIVIRAALVEGGVARVRAGAGVMHDSDPAREAEETRHKAAAVLQAIVASAGAAAEVARG